MFIFLVKPQHWISLRRKTPERIPVKTHLSWSFSLNHLLEIYRPTTCCFSWQPLQNPSWLPECISLHWGRTQNCYPKWTNAKSTCPTVAPSWQGQTQGWEMRRQTPRQEATLWHIGAERCQFKGWLFHFQSSPLQMKVLAPGQPRLSWLSGEQRTEDLAQCLSHFVHNSFKYINKYFLNK